MEEFGKLEERVVLVGVQTDDHDNVEESLDELKELASTAGAVTVGRIIQNRESVHPGTYIGKGKIEEVRALVYAMDATGIICCLLYTSFVGIPLPGTGAWTGSLIASLLEIDIKKSSLAIFCGIIMATVIMYIVSYGLVGNLVR